MHVIVESPEFLADAKAAGLSEQDGVAGIIDRLAKRPDSGDLIPARVARARSASPDGAKARAVAIA